MVINPRGFVFFLFPLLSSCSFVSSGSDDGGDGGGGGEWDEYWYVMCVLDGGCSTRPAFASLPQSSEFARRA